MRRRRGSLAFLLRRRLRLSWHACRRRAQTSHRVVGRLAVRGADATVLVGVGGDVRDELLGCEREEAGEVWWGCVGAGAWGWETGEGEVVGGDCVGDLKWVRALVMRWRGSGERLL